MKTAAEVAARLHVLADEASDTDTGVIRCEHLLGGLVRLGRGIAASVLTEAGVDPTALADSRPGH